MSYPVETSGTLLLPEELERQALTVLEIDSRQKSSPAPEGAAARMAAARNPLGVGGC